MKELANFQNLKDRLQDYFVEVVSLINMLVDLRSGSFSSMLEINERLDAESREFMADTSLIIKKISESLNRKIDSINIKGMQDEIQESTDTFLVITDDLELLSYNTICRTMSLGQRGATLAHLSKEIKKHSEEVKDLLVGLTDSFGAIYKDFKEITDTFTVNSNKMADFLDDDVASEEDKLTINSRIDDLIQYSQFHDIISQELDTIYQSAIPDEADDAASMGENYGRMLLSIEKSKAQKEKALNTLREIKNVVSEFLFEINTDIQNMVSRANIAKSHFMKAKNYSGSIEQLIDDMSEMVDNTKKQLTMSESGVARLGKFSKSFRNLVVIAAVEVARIGDDNLHSVVTSMQNTETTLTNLMSKMRNSIEMWSELRSEFEKLLNDASGNLSELSRLHSDKRINNMLETSAEMDEELGRFKNSLNESDIIDKIDDGLDVVASEFDLMIEAAENILAEYDRSIPEEIKQDSEFIRACEQSEIHQVEAQEEDHSSIDFF